MRSFHFDHSQKISSALSLLFVLVFAVLVGWLVVNTGAQIVESADTMPAARPEIRAELEKPSTGE